MSVTFISRLRQINDPLWSVVIATVMLALLSGRTSPIAGGVGWAIERLGWLAPQSYTLYLFHFPFLVLLAAAYLRAVGALPRSFALVALGVVASVVLSGLAAKKLERIGR